MYSYFVQFDIREAYDSVAVEALIYKSEAGRYGTGGAE
jgi:hypothetical protein